ncbi:MAG: hypothetical protein ACRD2E_02115 [Terriglobales bacterium]
MVLARPTRSRQLLVLLLLAVVPFVSWVGSTGGIPICCWGSRQCAMTAMAGMAAPSGPAMTQCARRPTCQMHSAVQLILPAPALPVFPSSLTARLHPPVPIGAWRAEATSAPLPAHSRPVYHPPLG